MLIEAESNNTEFRPYVFLDALISGGGKYVSNVYALESELNDPESVLFLPVLLGYLERQLFIFDEENYRSRGLFKQQMRIAREDLEVTFKKLGFSKGTIGVGLKQARRRRFLVGLEGENFEIVDYFVNRNLVLGHLKLMREAPYSDNMVQQLGHVFEISVEKFTTGFESRQLGDRVLNTNNFLRWLANSERNFISKPAVAQARELWEELEIPSAAHAVVWHYAKRLRGILASEKNPPPAAAEDSLRFVLRKIIGSRYLQFSRDELREREYESVLMSEFIQEHKTV